MRLTEHVLDCEYSETTYLSGSLVNLTRESYMTVPPDVLKLKEERGNVGATDCMLFIFTRIYQSMTSILQRLTLVNMTESHRAS